MAAGDRPEEGCAGETGISDELRGRFICQERITRMSCRMRWRKDGSYSQE